MTETTALSTVFERVRPPTTFEETVARLGTGIRLGVLAPGARLPPERELAEQLGISRSTLLQALKALTESGHLVAVRGRSGGTFVSDSPPIAAGEHVSLEDSWRGLLDHRIAVELGTAQLAAERRADEDVERLAEHVDAMAAAEDWTAYRRADVFFHLCLAEAAHSPRLVAAMTELHGQLNDLFDRVAHPSTALDHSNEQHLRILRAVRERKPGRAVAQMREHLEGTERILEGLLP